MRSLSRLLLFAVVSTIATRLAALVVSRRCDHGSEVSDEFRRVVVFSGLDFTSRARGLRRAEVSVIFGGVRIDLRDAVIDPAGASLLLESTLGGADVMVRDDWAVTVKETLDGGQTDVSVTSPADLPADAPALRISVSNRLASTTIRATGSRI